MKHKGRKGTNAAAWFYGQPGFHAPISEPEPARPQGFQGRTVGQMLHHGTVDDNLDATHTILCGCKTPYGAGCALGEDGQ